jgi:ribosome recycling factor
MFDKIKADTISTMDKSIENFKTTLSKIRAGRPNPSILDQVSVDYFGTNTPIKQLANITVSDASTISLSVWDKNAVSSIEKSLTDSNLGVNPVVNGTNIHIKFPPLTQERRSDLNKIVKKEGETIKITLRNIRRNSNTSISNLEKEKQISKDFERDYIIEIQDLTDKYIKTSEDIVTKKIQEISEV